MRREQILPETCEKRFLPLGNCTITIHLMLSWSKYEQNLLVLFKGALNFGKKTKKLILSPLKSALIFLTAP